MRWEDGGLELRERVVRRSAVRWEDGGEGGGWRWDGDSCDEVGGR